ncbi:hypothetical protein E1B28_010060 [Marasmius oreades]|uniref:Uncharacterized protein n=1 Tax=Marasmius oreades TaxID=181124 RepID=A0A9P7UR36_9AGAR|nr:uncharacterized protein E1B28_010060 [Marasmius oreades]KAG7090993.1 hypothetical protein E1B28_010060 [Marasmius oreades]
MVVVHRAKTWSSPSESADITAHDYSESSNKERDENEEGTEDVKETKKNLEAEVKVLKKQKQRHFYATRRFLFPLGILLGVLLAFALVTPADIHQMHNHLTVLLQEMELSIPEIPGFDLSRLEIEWDRLRSSIPEVWKFNRDGREFQVGERMAERGLSAKYPVIIIPGVISTALESWSTAPDFRPFFREKMWGGLSMLSQVTFNREKWIQAMTLDPYTGLDPQGTKIRAAEGINAASMFIQGYWIWYFPLLPRAY